jgi:hypothetical protein
MINMQVHSGNPSIRSQVSQFQNTKIFNRKGERGREEEGGREEEEFTTTKDTKDTKEG